MTPEQRQSILDEFQEKLNSSREKVLLLLIDLKTSRMFWGDSLSTKDKEELDQAIENLEDVFKKLTIKKSPEITDDYTGYREEILNLLADARLYVSEGQALYDEIETLQGKEEKKDQENKKKPVVYDSINLKAEKVDLNLYPNNCAEFGAHVGGAVKVGDAHACMPKILYFALKTGVARIKDGSDKKQVYNTLIDSCSALSSPAVLVGEVPILIHYKIKTLRRHILSFINAINQFEFHQEAVILLLGDLFMDRNGNDLLTAHLFRRIKACGARVIVPISNHDARFLTWLATSKIVDEQEWFISTRLFRQLIELDLSSVRLIHDILHESYFDNLVAFYYEIGPEGNLNNIASHAPCGEWEIVAIANALANYAKQANYQNLFTESQKQQLLEIQSVKYDTKKGLSSEQLKKIIDLINNIVHTNATKKDKRDLHQLLYLGADQLSLKQQCGNGIPIEWAPLYYILWNRDSPRPAPPQGEKRLYINGHHASAHHTSDWSHQNLSLDDAAGKAVFAMKDIEMLYALPVQGYTPMPKIMPPPVEDVSKKREAKTEVKGSPSNNKKRKI